MTSCPECGVERPDEKEPCAVCVAAQQPIGAGTDAPPASAGAEPVPSPPGTPSLPNCPACNAEIPAGAERCPHCELHVAALAASGYSPPADPPKALLPLESERRWRFRRPGLMAAGTILAASLVSAGLIAAAQAWLAARPRRGSPPWPVQANSALAQPAPLVGSTVATESRTGVEGRAGAVGPGVRWRVTTAGVVAAAPAVSAGRAYVGDLGNAVICVDLSRGEQLWKRPPVLDGWVAAAPTVMEEIVLVVTTAGTLYAIDAADGRILAQSSVGRQAFATPCRYGSRIVAASADGEVVSFDWIGAGFQRAWRAAAGDGVCAGLALAGQSVIVATHGRGEVLALALEDGRLRWRSKLGAPVLAGPAIWGEAIFVVGTREGESVVARLEHADGTTTWTRTVPGRVMVAPAVDGRRVVVCAGSAVHALSVDDGATLWMQPLRELPGAPAIAAGRVWLGTFGRAAVVLDVETGEVRETYATSWYTPAGGSLWEGKWVLGGYDRQVYCIETGLPEATGWREAGGGPERGGYNRRESGAR